MNVTITGAGGMIGGHLVKTLLDQGHDVRGVDIKPRSQWWQWDERAENWPEMDCSNEDVATVSCRGAQHVYNLAEDMGGIGYITSHVVACAESIKIGLAMLKGAHRMGVERFFFSSSACIYPIHLQGNAESLAVNTVTERWMQTGGLQESDAWPAQPEDGYGLSKLFIEEMCRYYREAGKVDTRVARYHNVFGRAGSWNDGKEKAPAAICRKVAEARLSGDKDYEIEVWGDGSQLRSYLHVDDCIRGTITLMESNHVDPINIGSNFAVTVDELIETVSAIADWPVLRRYDTTKPLGVGARNADITKAKEVLEWVPLLTLEQGLADLYQWIEAQVTEKSAAASGAASEGLQTTTA